MEQELVQTIPTYLKSLIGPAALYYSAFMTIWGFWRVYKKEIISSDVWGALAILEGLIVVQGGLGLYQYIFSGQKVAGDSLHMLYGAISALALPVVFAFTRGRSERREMLLYAVTLLVLSVLLLRAMMTRMGFEVIFN